LIESEIITGLDPLRIGRLVDRKALFLQHWRLRKGTADQSAWNHRMAVELEPMFQARLSAACGAGLFEPAAVLAVVPTYSSGDSMFLLDRDCLAAPGIEIVFARQHDGACVADGIRPDPAPGRHDVLTPRDFDQTGWFVATLGHGVASREAELKADGSYEEYYLFHGLATALAEALAEEIHRLVRVRLGISQFDAATPAGIAGGGYLGVRLSPGYRCCPDLAQQTRILKMLDAGRIGVSLTESFQMVPELSVSALVIAGTPSAGF